MVAAAFSSAPRTVFGSLTLVSPHGSFLAYLPRFAGVRSCSDNSPELLNSSAEVH
jgi:hypothetical protein